MALALEEVAAAGFATEAHEAVIGEGEVAAVRWTARMTHSGDDLGFPATQKRLEITGTTFVRFKDGKAVEGWDNWDMLGLMNAIGQGPYTRAIPLEKTR